MKIKFLVNEGSTEPPLNPPLAQQSYHIGKKKTNKKQLTEFLRGHHRGDGVCILWMHSIFFQYGITVYNLSIPADRFE